MKPYTEQEKRAFIKIRNQINKAAGMLNGLSILRRFTTRFTTNRYEPIWVEDGVTLRHYSQPFAVGAKGFETHEDFHRALLTLSDTLIGELAKAEGEDLIVLSGLPISEAPSMSNPFPVLPTTGDLVRSCNTIEVLYGVSEYLFQVHGLTLAAKTLLCSDEEPDEEPFEQAIVSFDVVFGIGSRQPHDPI